MLTAFKPFDAKQFIGKILLLMCGLVIGLEAFTQIIINPIPIIKAPSTTTISSSANPSLVGQPVLLTATITSPAQGTPTGTVHFYDAANTDLTPAGVQIINGKATFTTAILTGSTSFTATYSGDGGNLASTSAVFSQTVNNPPIYIPPTDIPFYLTTTTLVSSANPSLAGSEPVIFTATVTGGNNPTGLVEFWDNTNNTNLTPSGVAIVNGVATFTTSSLPFGDLSISAVYRGDANGNQQSISNTVVQRVQLNITGIGITLTADVSKVTTTTAGTTNWGDRITFIATVSTGIGAPSGTVVFADNGFLLGSAKMDGSGIATITTNLLKPGTHNITASYYSITSNVLAYNVIPPFEPYPFGSPGAGLVPSRVSMKHSSGYNVLSNDEIFFNFGDASPYGKPVTLAVYVGGVVGYIPTGNVTFQFIREFDVIDLGEVGLDLAGNALFTTSILPVGQYQVRAIYGGNDIYEPSASSRTIKIGPAQSTTSISSNLNPSIAGQQITFTATVPPAFPEGNALPPQGDVTFIIDGIDQQPTAPLTGNFYKAFFDISSLTPGTHTIKAHYPGDWNGGDPNYKGSTSGTITQVVEKVGDAIFYFLGNEQTTQINTAFLNALQFNIVNINPKLTGGASVTFTAPSSGPSGTFANGTNTITVNTSALGSFGVANSGIFTANGEAGTYIVTATIPGFGTATFNMTNTAPPVQVSVGTSVEGFSFSVDGFTFTSNRSFNWEPGKTHSIATTSPQTAANGIQYTFTGWSDGNNSLARTVTIPTSPVSYIAQFTCEKLWVLDNDLDNYYTGEPVSACQSPGEGYLLKGDLKPGDCNDNDDDINPETIWLLDTDGDGYHEKIYIAQPSCSPPQDGRNYINNSKGQDCNDNDATYTPETVWVIDADGDGYYTGEPFNGCPFIFPTGAVRKTNQQSGDCDDSNKNVTTGSVWYKDSDNDNYYDALYISQPSCTSPGTGFKNTGLLGPDCNDNDKNVYNSAFMYYDQDGDGYANDASLVKICFGEAPPATYSSTSLGIDNCPTVSNPVQKDTDADGQGDACDTDDDNDGIIDTNDCAPLDNSKWRSAMAYYDVDGDGYTTSQSLICYGNTLPAGYVLTSKGTDNCASESNPDQKDTDADGQGDICDIDDDNDGTNDTQDCAPLDNSKWRSVLAYIDTDEDGYSAGTATICYGSLLPVGYSLLSNGTDCNDNNGLLTTNIVYYFDGDADGFGDPLKTTSVCSLTAPNGYVTNNTDCNDANPSVNPAAVEVCRNGIDDNCNGIIDEGVCAPCRNGTEQKTINITSNSATFVWSALANSDQWHIQYKTTNKGSKWIDVFVTGNKRSFTINTLLSNQNYTWQIRAKCGKGWTDYAPAVSFKTLGSASAVEARTTEIVHNNLFEVTTAPNPSDSYFTLTVRSSNNNERILMRVIDELGRVVEQKENVMPGTTVRFGDKYIPGIYFVLVQQGNNSKSVKLIRR